MRTVKPVQNPVAESAPGPTVVAVPSEKPLASSPVAPKDPPPNIPKSCTGPEQLEARLQAVLADGEKRVKDMAELQTKMLITHLGRMATERRDSLRAEMEQFLAELCRSYLQKVHQQAQTDLKALNQRIALEKKQALEGILQDVQDRLKTALGQLERKESNEAA